MKSAKGKNLALLAKLNWRFHTEKDSLWAKVLKSKYCSHRRVNSRNADKLPCSGVWKAMKKGSTVFKKGMRWIPGGSSKLSFWHDNWTMSGPLRSAIQSPLLEEEEILLVKDFNGPGRWDWSKLSFLLPKSILMELKSIPHSTLVSSMEDRLIWSGTSHGDFDLKSAYYLAMNFQDSPTPFSGQWVWKMETLLRIKFFIWLCLHDSIGMGVCLARKGLRDLETCQICQREPKTIPA